MKTIQFFENVQAILNTDIEVSDEFIPLDKNLFLQTGKFEYCDGEPFEICFVQKGSRVMIQKNPAGEIYLIDNSGLQIHANLKDTDFILPPGVQFAASLKAVPGKLGLFS